MNTSAVWLAGFRGGLISPHEQIRLAEPITFADATVRQTLRIAGGGSRFRVRISNRFGRTALTIGAALVGEHALLFDGASTVTIPAGAELFSDAVDLAVQPGTDLVVSLYLPDPTGPATAASQPGQTALVAPGDRTADADLPDAERLPYRVFLDAVDVFAEPQPVLAAFGDSWFEGVGTTPNAHLRSVDVLNRELGGGWAVNLGIAGNRLLRTEVGPSALDRFEHDVLAVPGVSRVLVNFGINDLILGGYTGEQPPAAGAMIAGYTELARRAHDAGLPIHAATIGPFAGCEYPNLTVDAGIPIRREVNEWLRTTTVFDSVADIARTVEDPARPDHLAPELDSGDCMHLNNAGAHLMALEFLAALPAVVH
ncbi:GDSL-type esterase/lipase family protein [Nocardia sp. NPDC057227]|uniref:GDSL-type esterase/lipase family protein n=1 Tax=Nocardia sp. NPDC057227 TaxID=3346056 RepID=UPI003625D85F